MASFRLPKLCNISARIIKDYLFQFQVSQSCRRFSRHAVHEGMTLLKHVRQVASKYSVSVIRSAINLF